MKIDKIALAFFIFFSIMATVSSALEWNGILLLCKPLIIPALTFYYLGNTKKVSRSVTLFLISCFIGDAIALFNFEHEIFYLLVPFFVGNLVIIRLAFLECKRFYWDAINVVSLLLILLLLGYLWVTVVSFFWDETGFLFFAIAIFGLTLLVMNVLTAYNGLSSMKFSNLYLLLTSISILVSQVFYVLYTIKIQLDILDLIHQLCHYLSYLSLVLFILNYPKYKVKES